MRKSDRLLMGFWRRNGMPAIRQGTKKFNANTLYEPDVTRVFSVSLRSWVVFFIMESTGEWMSLPVDRWEKSDEYMNIASIVTELSVVNDTAE